MSDPIKPPDPNLASPPEPGNTRTARTKKFAEKGVTKDVAGAKKRVATPKKPMKKYRSFGSKLEANFFEAVEDMAERYDVPFSVVVRKGLTEQLRKHGNLAEKTKGGLLEPEKHNPFDPLQAQPRETIVSQNNPLAYAGTPHLAQAFQPSPLTAVPLPNSIGSLQHDEP